MMFHLLSSEDTVPKYMLHQFNSKHDEVVFSSCFSSSSTDEINNGSNSMNESIVQRPDERIFVEEVLFPNGKGFRFFGAQIINSSWVIRGWITHLHESWFALFLLVVVPGGTFFTPETQIR